MHTRRWIALLVAGSLTLAACGDDGDSSADTSGAGADTSAAGADTTAAGGGDGAAGAAAACDGSGNGTLKIGYAADFSEVGAAADKPGSEAAAYAVDQLNAEGGVNGTPVELVVKNIDGDPAVTQQAAEELLDTGVSAILGPPFVNFGGPLLTVTAGSVPVISVASTDVQLANFDQGAFLSAFADPRQDGAAAELATDLGKKTAITFSSPDDPYFTNNPKWFTEAFEELGGEVVQDFSYSLADSDFSSQVNEIENLDPRPDVLYTAMIMPLIGTLLGQLRGAGIDDITVIGADAFDATNVAAAGDDAEGVYYTTHVFPEEGSAVADFAAAFEESTGAPLETVTFGALAADAVGLLAQACEAAGSTDPAALSAALQEIEGYDGLTGSITYQGTNGAPIKPVTIVQIKDGQPTLFDQIDPQTVPEP